MIDVCGVSRARLIKKDRLDRVTFHNSSYGVRLVAEDRPSEIEITATISNGWFKRWYLVRNRLHMNVEFLRHVSPYMAKALRDEISYDAVADQYPFGRIVAKLQEHNSN